MAQDDQMRLEWSSGKSARSVRDAIDGTTDVPYLTLGVSAKPLNKEGGRLIGE